MTLKFYQFLYFYMELFNTDPDPTHYFGMNPWWMGSFRIFTYRFPFSFLMVSAFESNLEFEDNGKGKLSTLGGAPGWWCGPTSIRSKIRCIPSGALRTFTLRHSAAPPFSHGQTKTGKFTPTRNVGCNGNALVNCSPSQILQSTGIVIVLFVCSEFHDVTLGGWVGTLCVGWKDPKINPIHIWYAAMQ